MVHAEPNTRKKESIGFELKKVGYGLEKLGTILDVNLVTPSKQ